MDRSSSNETTNSLTGCFVMSTRSCLDRTVHNNERNRSSMSTLCRKHLYHYRRSSFSTLSMSTTNITTSTSSSSSSSSSSTSMATPFGLSRMILSIILALILSHGGRALSFPYDDTVSSILSLSLK
ncbi:hypothetical protein BLOT_013073 [Blomia tropicalis]|nr:hypothetical protein BLOT_013073 [Blomia tropicalis]